MPYQDGSTMYCLFFFTDPMANIYSKGIHWLLQPLHLSKLDKCFRDASIFPLNSRRVILRTRVLVKTLLCVFKHFRSWASTPFIKFFSFNLQMPGTRLRPTSTMKTYKSSAQRFGHMNTTNHNSYLNDFFISFFKARRYA